MLDLTMQENKEKVKFDLYFRSYIHHNNSIWIKDLNVEKKVQQQQSSEYKIHTHIKINSGNEQALQSIKKNSDRFSYI